MVFAYVHYKHHLGFKPERLSLVLTTDAILDSNQNGLRLYLLQTPFWIQTKMVFACAHNKRHLGFKPHWRSLVLTTGDILDSKLQLAFVFAHYRRHFGFKPQWPLLVQASDAILDSNHKGLRLYLIQTPFWIQTKMVLDAILDSFCLLCSL